MTASFWLILLAVLIYGLVHSILASLAFKAWICNLFGPATDRWYRLGFNMVAVVTFLPVLALPLLLPDKKIYTIPFPWVILSLVVQLLAVIVVYIGIHQTGTFAFLGLQQAFLRADPSPPHLVSSGLYHYVRHPLYTAGLVFIWLLPLMTWNLLAVNIGITLYILIGIRFEERKLLRELGEPYAEYRKRTPMLIPGLIFSHTERKS